MRPYVLINVLRIRQILTNGLSPKQSIMLRPSTTTLIILAIALATLVSGQGNGSKSQDLGEKCYQCVEEDLTACQQLGALACVSPASTGGAICADATSKCQKKCYYGFAYVPHG